MNLPFVLDIAIGLIFIYLVLSLLASEIQELIATLLQWRAKHLIDSIKNLLEGGECITEEEKKASLEKGECITEEEKVEKLVKTLYNHPLLKNVNQESRGFLEKKFRSITWVLSDTFSYRYHLITNKPNKEVVTNKPNKEEGVFGDKRTGPSYISSETFATTLIETLNIPELVKKLVNSRFKNFSKKMKDDIGKIAKAENIDLETDGNSQLYTQESEEIVKKFLQNEATLTTSIEQMSASLDRYIQSYSDNNYKNFTEQVKSLKANVFGDKNERAIILGGLKPTLTEIIDSLKITSKIHKEIEATLSDQNDETYQTIKKVLEKLPQSVQASLAILARRAQTRVQITENEIHQLTEEISIWFDRSMARSSGVYKRNAKGVAILIGFAIAFAINADAFHIFNKLSNDETLRHVVTERASQIALSSPNSETITQAELERIKVETNSALKDISLPIGWNSANLSQQIICNSINKSNLTDYSAPSDGQEWNLIFNHCLPNQQNSTTFFLPKKIFELMLAYPFAALKMIVGWFLSAIAIAMGAPFWFDLLSKVVNVRNSGSQPPSEDV
ncbi:MAG: hypothetical protein KME05_08445 [Gloeocapsa sp. UFS-A4-WI-NPMV-4B04]|jgi:hypothetical protein|nr:hypothetical protein [Gloeocapsa sp. UFS-A4-WI-NPMV-4B04]